MSKLFLALALLATIGVSVHATTFTFTLSGNTYTDSGCTAGAQPFTVSTTATDDGSQPTQTCTADGTRFVQGLCVPAGFSYGGQTSQGSYSFVVYANSTCASVSVLASASANTGIDTSACVALSPASAGYVKFSTCTVPSSSSSTGGAVSSSTGSSSAVSTSRPLMLITLLVLGLSWFGMVVASTA